MSFPIIYDKFETNFHHLGLGVLQNITECQIVEERNGAFYLEMTTVFDERVQEDNILKVDTSGLKDQRFRIRKVTDNHDGTSDVYAEHISYLAQDLTLKPITNLKDVTAQEALTSWKEAILEDNPFEVMSDFEGTSSFNWKVQAAENPRRVLGGVEGSILQSFNGEYVFDNYYISLLKKRGTKSQSLLAYGRNITGFEYESDMTETYTSIYPIAIYSPDGEGHEEEVLVTIDELVVDIEDIANYPNRRTLVVDFSEEFRDDETPTQEKLRKLAKKYIQDNNVGVPKINIKVDFIDLASTEEYSEFKHLESVHLCDEVAVSYAPLQLMLTAKVIRTEWDVLGDRYNEIELGNFKRKLSDALNSTATRYVNDKVSDITTVLVGQSQVIKEKSRVFRQEEEPQSAEINDLWLFSNELKVFDGADWQVQTIKSKRHEEVVELNSETAKTITLPTEFKDKDFRVTLSIFDTLDTTKTTKQIVLKQTAQSIENSTVEIVGYKKMNDDSIEAIQAMLIAEY